jgi:hypothetical protein
MRITFGIIVVVLLRHGLGEIPPVLKIPVEYFRDSITKFQLNSLYSRGVCSIQLRRKPYLEYGEPSAHVIAISDFIESIPVEERLRDLQRMQAGSHRRQHLRGQLQTWYKQYIVASSFIDVRLLRLLIRVATRRLSIEELGLSTASDIIEHMRNKYSNGSFDYLTPEYILEWYEGLASHRERHDRWSRIPFTLMCLDDKKFAADIVAPDSDKQLFVQMGFHVWQAFIIDSRIQRLKLTGYEQFLVPDVPEALTQQ